MARPLRILYLANQRLPTEKAYGIQITAMCRAFAHTGAEVKLATPSRRGPQGEDTHGFYGTTGEFQFRRVRAPEFYPLGIFERPAFWLRQTMSAVLLAWHAFRSKADIIYCRDEGVAILAALFGKKVCLELHSYTLTRKPLYWMLLILRVRIVCITRALANRIVSAGFSGARILVAPDGVDVEKFTPNLAQGEARRRVHLPGGISIVLYAGHFYPWKGAHVLAEAAPKIDGLVVFVGGTDSDISRFKSRYGHIPNIMLVGHRPHSEIPTWLRAADVLVLPNTQEEAISREYTSPLKMFEYMASGTPIVASDLPSIREVLNDENARFVLSGNSDTLVQGIRLAISDTHRGQRARADVEQYSWSTRAQSIMRFIDDQET